MDVAEVQHRGIFPPFTVTGVYVSATTASVSAVPGIAKETLYINKINVAVTTSAAQALTIRDTSGRVAAVVVASAPVGPVSFDFGPDGFPLTEGAGLEVVGGGTGIAGSYTILGYRRATQPRSITEAKAGIA